MIPQFAELGLMGIDIPADLGGAGGTFFMSVLAVEELSRVDASTAILVDVQNTLVNAPLLAWGSDDLKGRYLPAICRGEALTAIAVTEPGGGSDVAAIRTRAVRDGVGVGLAGSIGVLSSPRLRRPAL